MTPVIRLRRLALVALTALAAFSAGCHQQAPRDTQAAAASPATQDFYYTCTMHPQVHLDHPGNCPICGMKLVKHPVASAAASMAPMAGMPASSASSQPPLPPGLQEVSLSPEQQVLANVSTQAVEPRALSRSLSAAGRITYDEARQAQVTARVGGRLDRLYVNTTGASIRAGEPIAAIYSPELVAAMQDYLTARASYQAMRRSSYQELAQSSAATLDAARQRLTLLGVSESQLDTLARTGKPSLDLPLLSPASGVVVKKLVVQGQYVKEGDVLYELADLSSVWAEADVFESALSQVKVGAPVTVTTPAYPGESFRGRVAFIYPFLNGETRTVRVRVALPNPGGRLKPDMFVTAEIQPARLQANPLAVPATAVVDTGKRRVVFVEVASGVFRPREVTLGAKAGDSYPVLGGLKRGERVATSGGFLLDANSQIQSGGMQDMPGMDGKP